MKIFLIDRVFWTTIFLFITPIIYYIVRLFGKCTYEGEAGTLRKVHNVRQKIYTIFS